MPKIPQVKRGRYKQQSRAEFEKNYKRVTDIVERADGDVDKKISLSKTQANRITNEMKAINRAMAAKEAGETEIFDVFFFRAYELGVITKQDFRSYQLEKLGL